MFGKEFYPTGIRTIIGMIPAELFNKLDKLSILEPQAGKGDICDYLVNKKVNRQNIYCIEIDPDLRLILQGHGYKVIANDFLTYRGGHHFDLILMNPPFSNGDEHLLHAWEIMTNGDIVCLLNAETIRNPYTESRKLLAKIIADNNGTVTYLQDQFKDTERKTGVEIAKVHLKKNGVSKFDFKFKKVTSEKGVKLDEEILTDSVATKDVIGNMIVQFDKLKETYIEYMEVKKKLEFYATGLTSETRSVASIIKEAKEHSRTKAQQYNLFTDGMRQQIWGQVFKTINMQQYMTSAVRANFEKFSTTQGALDFTRENVGDLIEMLFENKTSILEQAIVDVFDLCTDYYKENRLHVEGWKTNDKWKVNRKIIIPNVVSMSSGHYECSYYNKTGQRFEDIDKVMCYLTGTDFESIQPVYKSGYYSETEKNADGKPKWISASYINNGSIAGTIKTIPVGSTEKVNSKFFSIRCYKKGTVHLEFIDKFLWQEFNMRACAGKNWLPETERKEWQQTKFKHKALKA